jgi:hypothetical protein
MRVAISVAIILASSAKRVALLQEQRTSRHPHRRTGPRCCLFPHERTLIIEYIKETGQKVASTPHHRLTTAEQEEQEVEHPDISIAGGFAINGRLPAERTCAGGTQGRNAQ